MEARPRRSSGRRVSLARRSAKGRIHLHNRLGNCFLLWPERDSWSCVHDRLQRRGYLLSDCRHAGLPGQAHWQLVGPADGPRNTGPSATTPSTGITAKSRRAALSFPLRQAPTGLADSRERTKRALGSSSPAGVFAGAVCSRIAKPRRSHITALPRTTRAPDPGPGRGVHSRGCSESEDGERR